ncbi:MAG: Tat pathway signal protein [Haloarculaceae archaeon]
MDPPDPSLSRREFAKAAVALGGAAGLAACLDRLAADPGTATAAVPRGDPDARPDRQHAWRAHVRHDEHGNSLLPNHQVLLYLTLDREGPPTADARETVATALDALDRAYAWDHDALLSSVAYSPAYFERFDADLPERLDLPAPRALSPFEDPTFDTQDLLVHLASDRADVLLEAEEALVGDGSAANGVAVEAKLTDVATVDSRRTGFVGAGLPAANQDAAGIPDSKPVPAASPLFLGFEAGFRGNQATEDHVTVDEGPFAGGTTKAVANLRQRLDDWYGEQTFEERVAEMFSPAHAERGLVEEVREAMNGTDVTRATPAVRQRVNNGILEYIFVRRRGNFLVPPRRHRALPPPRPG